MSDETTILNDNNNKEYENEHEAFMATRGTQFVYVVSLIL